MGDVLHGLLDQLVARIADDRAEPLIDAQVAAGGGVDVGDTHGRVVESTAKPLLALAEAPSSARFRSVMSCTVPISRTA